jgi:hypothetical protein
VYIKCTFVECNIQERAYVKEQIISCLIVVDACTRHVLCKHWEFFFANNEICNDVKR